MTKYFFTCIILLNLFCPMQNNPFFGNALADESNKQINENIQKQDADTVNTFNSVVDNISSTVNDFQTNMQDINSAMDTNTAIFSTIIQSIIENQEKILVDIAVEQGKYDKSLPNKIIELNITKQRIYNDFNTLYPIYWFNRDEPVELTLMSEQVNRFIFQINELYEPLLHTSTQIKMRLQQLTNIVDSLLIINNDSVQSMLQRANKLKNAYTDFDSNLEWVFAETTKILERLEHTAHELEARMPEFWINFYLHQKTDFLSTFNVLWEIDFFTHLFASMKLTTLRETPSTLHAWIQLASSTLVIVLSFLILSLVINKLIKNTLPPDMQYTVKHVLKTSILWIVIGITLQYASWYGGNRYQFVHALGMFILCFGQIRLSWQLLCLKREELQTKSSPFNLLLLILIVTFLILSITEYSLSVFWIIFLLILLTRFNKARTINLTLSKFLIHSLYFVIVMCLILIIATGYVHLSIFIILFYICIIMGIHQLEACLYATSLLNKILPQNGVPALISGLLITIFIPITLTIALISPLSWILAFPGGEYLVKDLSDFDITVFGISFNSFQFFSIATVFYFVKSIITISCNYIDSTWSDNESSSIASLTTPIKTTIFFGFWGIFALYVLKIIGFNLTNIAVIAGGLSVGIGLGMQGMVQNTFSGFLLIFGQNIREGDIVEVGTTHGIVQKVSLRATKVRTFDNAIIFVPNSEFIGTSFINWTHNGQMVRSIVQVGVDYDSDLDLVNETIIKVLEKDKRILSYPEPLIYFMDFGASSLNFEVRYWIANIQDKVQILSDVRFALNKAFRDHGITVPFPQTDIRVRTETAELFKNSQNESKVSQENLSEQ